MNNSVTVKQVDDEDVKDVVVSESDIIDTFSHYRDSNIHGWAIPGWFVGEDKATYHVVANDFDEVADSLIHVHWTSNNQFTWYIFTASEFGDGYYPTEVEFLATGKWLDGDEPEMKDIVFAGSKAVNIFLAFNDLQEVIEFLTEESEAVELDILTVKQPKSLITDTPIGPLFNYEPNDPSEVKQLTKAQVQNLLVRYEDSAGEGYAQLAELLTSGSVNGFMYTPRNKTPERGYFITRKEINSYHWTSFDCDAVDIDNVPVSITLSGHGVWIHPFGPHKASHVGVVRDSNLPISEQAELASLTALAANDLSAIVNWIEERKALPQIEKLAEGVFDRFVINVYEIIKENNLVFAEGDSTETFIEEITSNAFHRYSFDIPDSLYARVILICQAGHGEWGWFSLKMISSTEVVTHVSVTAFGTYNECFGVSFAANVEGEDKLPNAVRAVVKYHESLPVA